MTITMPEISPAELKSMLDNGKDVQIIDVREEEELHYCTIGGKHIPMGEILQRIGEIRRDVPVVIHCRSGKRASAVVYTLEHKYHFTNLHNLRGGIIGYIDEIDPSMQKY
ncbi:MAG: hypothetical protein RL220_175 [Bacteroidota bacterium]|jgi:rhodanese-related sulfurtransferase